MIKNGKNIIYEKFLEKEKIELKKEEKGTREERESGFIFFANLSMLEGRGLCSSVA